MTIRVDRSRVTSLIAALVFAGVLALLGAPVWAVVGISNVAFGLLRLFDLVHAYFDAEVALMRSIVDVLNRAAE